MHRRRLLIGMGSVGWIASIAGCSGDEPQGNEENLVEENEDVNSVNSEEESEGDNQQDNQDNQDTQPEYQLSSLLNVETEENVTELDWGESVESIYRIMFNRPNDEFNDVLSYALIGNNLHQMEFSGLVYSEGGVIGEPDTQATLTIWSNRSGVIDTINTAFTENYVPPKQNDNNNPLKYADKQGNESMRLVKNLDELNIDSEPRSVSASGSDIKSGPTSYIRDPGFSVAIEENKIVIADDPIFAARQNYKIEYTTVSDKNDITVNTPPVDGEVTISNVELSDKGDYAVIESTTIDVDIPSEQVSGPEHRILVSKITKDWDNGDFVREESGGDGVTPLQKELDETYPLTETDVNGTDSFDLDIPSKPKYIPGSSEDMLPERNRVSYPIEDQEIIVVLIVGDVQIDTDKYNISPDMI